MSSARIPADPQMRGLVRFRLSVLLIMLVAVFGTAAFSLVERWSLFEALYVTILTMSTVGYTESHRLDDRGRALTIALIVASRVSETYAIVMFTQVVVLEQLRNLLGRRRMQSELGKLKDHYLICGWGRMGQEIVSQFQAKHVPFVVLDTNEEKCRRMAERGILCLNGDAADNSSLEAAGIARAKGLIAVAPDDAVNIFITLSARALNPKLLIVSRCQQDQDVSKLRMAGADRVISVYITGARRIAAAAFRPTVADFLDEVIHQPDLEWELEELPIKAGSAFDGRTLAETGIREQIGCTVVAIRRGGSGKFQSNPPGDFRLTAGDVILCLANNQQLERLHKAIA